MTIKTTGEGGGQQISLYDRIIPDPRAKYGIPVEIFAEHFNVNREVKAVLEKYPSLCYLLGSSTPQPVEVGGLVKQKYLLTEGSGMFGLKNEEEAREWAGIFNHSIGTARQIEYVAGKLASMTTEQRQQFIEAGFEFSEYDSFDPNTTAETLRDVFFPCHLGRRSYDERNRYGIADDAHPKVSGSEAHETQLDKFKAPELFWRLIKKVESHSDHILKEMKRDGRFRNILDAFLPYCDWTFDQTTVSLEQRFSHMKSRRADLDHEILDAFQKAGEYFESIFNQVFQTDLLQELKQLQPPEWEVEIRKAYCAGSGIKFADAFPAFIAQHPQLQDKV